MSIQGQGSSSSTINGEPMVTTSLRSSPASAAPTAELLEESPSVASSIGLGSTPIPVEQPSYGGDGLLDTKLSYYRQLSRNMAPNMQTLLAPPPSILENAHQVLLLKQGGQAGSASIIFTLWNTMMGSTLLIMPYCFQQAGWLLSALLSIFAAVVSQYSCSLILRYGMHSLGPSAEFADLAYEHLGRAGWTAALAASLLVVLAAACAMHLYMAHSLTQLVTYPLHRGGLDLARPADFSTAVSALITLGCAFPLANLPNMRLLARFNSLGVACILFQLLYAGVSAATAGLAGAAFSTEQMFRPVGGTMILGIFALSFFIHNSVLTIMRASARPQKQPRDLSVAYTLTWLCYAGMGISANLCPPSDDPASLDTKVFLSVEQPPAMAGWQLAVRFAVLLQCLTVYPILLYIIRAQAFTAFYFHRAHPNFPAVLLLNALLAATTLVVVVFNIGIDDVLRFAGAFASLVCVYAVPAFTHLRASRLRGRLGPGRMTVCMLLLLLGVLTAAVQFLPPQPRAVPPPWSNGTNNTNASLL